MLGNQGKPMGAARMGTFSGNDRFELQAKLGVGGYGAVYSALDRERGTRVALKILRRMSADALMRFKREFRTLAELRHPNLIRLGELFHSDGHWFFSMELIEGEDLLDHVRPGNDNGGDQRCDLRRLRPALAQLSDGLAALHEAGKIHRDVKPPNVRVDRRGRVVLLDFGLVTSLIEDGQSTEADVLGSIAYMAPEQGSADKVGPAADWYALGTVMFEAITGRLPFEGGTLKILIDKQRDEAPRLRDFVAHVPADLDELCAGLMRREPAERLGAAEILEVLRTPRIADFRATPMQPVRSLGSNAHRFVGQRRELDALHECQRASISEARITTAYVHGESGLGKTALVEAFVEEVRLQSPDLVVLSDRCYERETVPYKAFDGVVDQLTKFLRRLSEEKQLELLPRGVEALGVVFPVLRGVRPIARAVASQPLADSNVAFVARRALRELLQRVAAAYPLLMVIDDLHWADADSLTLLTELLEGDDAPAMTLLATGRRPRALREEVAAAVEQLIDGDEPVCLELQLRGLPPAEAEELAGALLGDGAARPMAHRIARESDGHPLFIGLLAYYAKMHDPRETSSSDLDHALRMLLDGMDAETRGLLEVISLAGAPISRSVSRQAAGLAPDVFADRLAELRAHRVVRQGSRGADTLEVVHERVTQVLMAREVGGALGAVHRRIAETLEASGSEDHEALAQHWAEAGEPSKAAQGLLLAAERAHRSQAFDAASRLYRLVLESPHVAVPRRELLERLADSLALAGCSRDAADIYLKLASDAAPDALPSIQRRAAEQLLRSGRFVESLKTAEVLLRGMGMSLPEGDRVCRMRARWEAWQLSRRGLGFVARDESSVEPSQLRDLDVLWSLSALSAVDAVRGGLLHTRHVRLALDAGDTSRAHRAIALVGLKGPAPTGMDAEELELQDQLSRLAAPHAAAPEVRGLAHAALSRRLFHLGQLDQSHAHAADAERLFVEECVGVRWELVHVRGQRYRCASLLGRYNELRERIPGLIAEARELQDMYALGDLQVAVGWLLPLIDGRPRQALDCIDEGLAVWPETNVLQHYLAEMNRGRVLLAADRPEEALASTQAAWRSWETSVFESPAYRAHAELLRAALSIAVAARAGSDRSRLLKDAERDLHRVRRLRVSGTLAQATTLSGCALYVRGDVAGALKRLGEAERQLQKLKRSAGVLAVQRAAGLIEGGPMGDARVAAATTAFRALGVGAPRIYYRRYCPGLVDLDRMESQPPPEAKPARRRRRSAHGRQGWR